MARKMPDMYERKSNIKYDFEDIALKDSSKIIKKKTDNVHEKHRERVRARFLREGLDNFADHNALELLLFYAIPVKDTNGLAHDLINTFGSLSAVFDARIEDLCKVNGVGEKTAILIKMIPQLFRKYETDKLKANNVALNSAELVAKYASKHFKGLTEERLYLMCLDATCNLLDFVQISSGTVKSTPLNVRLIAEKAYETNAASLILVHNHPSGITAPSKKDIDATINIANLTDAIGLHLSDHIIIGKGDDYFSFRKSEKWKHIFK